MDNTYTNTANFRWGTEIAWPLICQSFPCQVQGPNSTLNKSTWITITNVAELKQQRKSYLALGATYNPFLWNATHIAQVAKAAGFKYVIYTTVHCDGFANWPSNVTDFNIQNSALLPKGRDIFGELVTALRLVDIKIGAYLCPTMWNQPNFVWPDPLTSLNARGAESPTYDPLTKDGPNKWQKYLNVLHGMVKELADTYQPDFFWFDCHDSVPDMDTKLEEIVSYVRNKNPSSLIMTRNGIFSDYSELSDQSESIVGQGVMGQINGLAATPEFEVGTPLQASLQWAFDPNSKQKSLSEIISNLMMIVSKGGNYLINVAPDSRGLFASSAEIFLQRMSIWFDNNGEAIHDTTPMNPYESTDSNGGVVYYTSRPLLSGNKEANDEKGVIVYVLIPASKPNVQKVIQQAPKHGKPTGVPASSTSTITSTTTLISNPMHLSVMQGSNVLLSSFRPSLLSSTVQLTTVQLLGVQQPIDFQLDGLGLHINASTKKIPSFLKDGLVYKLTFETTTRTTEL